MLTIPMYTAPSSPDAAHRVIAPGGYEWWYFDAEDADSQLRIVAILFDGFVFHPGYLRQMARFKRRPTKHAPPLPAQYPCAYMAVYQHDRLIGQFMSQFPSGSCHAKTNELDVSIGPNHARAIADGSMELSMTGRPWTLSVRGPRTHVDQVLSTELSFKTRFDEVSEPRRFLSRELSGTDHFWILANPLCDVVGTVRLSGPSGFEHQMRGPGYHDHNLGTGPIGNGLKRWLWGRVLEPQRVTTFHAAYPTGDHLPEELHVVSCDSRGQQSVDISASSGAWNRRSQLLLPYPDQWSLDNYVELKNPRIVDSTPFYLRLLYDAIVQGRPGHAFCEIAYPHRLRWPVLGRMIEMSIDYV